MSLLEEVCPCWVGVSFLEEVCCWGGLEGFKGNLSLPDACDQAVSYCSGAMSFCFPIMMMN